MEVSQEVIPRPSGKSIPADITDKQEDIFWDAHWTLDDEDQQPEATLVQP
jgi:hypothetical protein